MARQDGARFTLAGAFESTYGTAPTTGYRVLPCARFGAGSTKAMQDPELLGTGYDPIAPEYGPEDVAGELVIPVDVRAIGWWLKAAMGAVTPSNASGVYTHAFQSGATSLPSFSLEKQLPQVPTYEMLSGCMVNTLSMTMQRSGLLRASVGILGKSEARATSTGAGTPTTYTDTRFKQAHGSIKRNGSAFGEVLEATVNWSNNLEGVEELGNGGFIGAIARGMCSLSGSLRVRLQTTTLRDQAIGETGISFEFALAIDANNSLTIAAHNVFVAKPSTEVQGPQGVDVTFEWMAARATSPARMATVTLVNDVASY